MPTETFTTDTDWTVPDSVAEVTIEALGGQGVSNLASGGDGGRVKGTLSVTEGNTLYVRFVDGGDIENRGQEGGSAADVRRGGTALSDRLVVAAGGGGGGEADAGDDARPGGAGGADVGEDGGTPDELSQPGEGGTQSAGGAGGTGDSANGDSGVFGNGGDGGYDGGDYGGAGGAGWYGGGGGGVAVTASSAGGGGGSNYDDGLDTVSANERGTSPRSNTDGEIILVYVATPQNVAVTLDGSDATLTWSDPADIDQINIYRGDSPGVDTSGTPYATVSAGVETYTDSGLPDGQDFYYRLTATDADGNVSNDSDEVSVSTPLPAPTDLAVLDARASEADLSWTANHDNGETRIDLAEDDDGNWTEQTTVAYTVESVTLSGILNGQLYGVRVVAQTDDAETVDQ